MVGIDIEEIKRFKKLTDHFIERIYTKNEIEYSLKKANPHIHFAGIWCAKEAVVKCLSGLNLIVKKIEILHKENGQPFVKVTDEIKKYFEKEKIKNIHISISHTNKIATAIAIIEK